MMAAQGILTSRGGKTSHAAIVAVGMGKPAVCGVGAIKIDEKARTMTVAGQTLNEGDEITIDGATGRVFVGALPLEEPDVAHDGLPRLMEWADKARRLKVRANADTPEEATRAREWGAEGIGLCRTEHMFREEDRVPIVQRMILADDPEVRQEAIDLLRPFQEGDFAGIFRAMKGLPVTIRLLDPPLHEFLPSQIELVARVERGRALGTPDADAEAQLPRVQDLHEVNPMLGTRGCRLGIGMPEIYRMQVQAIISAACTVAEESGDPPLVEIMIPLVGFEEELRRMRELVVETADAVLAERGRSIEYLVGTMIEVPRAAIIADEIARQADFFSFGTNDLTQTVLAFSRDDAEGKFLSQYLETGVLTANPFDTLDLAGVGKLIQMAAEGGRATKKDLKLGICGEHGGDPESVKFCHRSGLDYVSCSPFRVQVARISAGQAALDGDSGTTRDR
jgi:pyruvate,orthophosphate dikinase